VVDQHVSPGDAWAGADAPLMSRAAEAVTAGDVASNSGTTIATSAGSGPLSLQGGGRRLPSLRI
jgi:hypothetical protein